MPKLTEEARERLDATGISRPANPTSPAAENVRFCAEYRDYWSSTSKLTRSIPSDD